MLLGQVGGEVNLTRRFSATRYFVTSSGAGSFGRRAVFGPHEAVRTFLGADFMREIFATEYGETCLAGLSC